MRGAGTDIGIGITTEHDKISDNLYAISDAKIK